MVVRPIHGSNTGANYTGGNTGGWGFGTTEIDGAGITLSPDGTKSSTALVNNSGLGITHAGSNGSYSSLQINTGAGKVLWVGNDAKIGIKNSDPVTELDVRGTISGSNIEAATKITTLGKVAIGTATLPYNGLLVSDPGGASSTSLGNVSGVGITTSGTNTGYYALQVNTGIGALLRVNNGGIVDFPSATKISGSSTSTGSFGHLVLGNRDTDASFEFGRAHIGYIGYSDMAGFSHVDLNAAATFALAQSAAGKTIINAKSGQPIAFKINNSDKVQISSDGNLGVGIETALHKLHVVGNGLFTGDLTVGGTITAQEFHTEFVSSSIVFASGSTKFGDTQDDIHNFTGSFRQSGSGADHYFLTGNVGIGDTNAVSKAGTFGNATTLGIIGTDSSGNGPTIQMAVDTTADSRPQSILFFNRNNADTSGATVKHIAGLRAFTVTSDSNSGDDSGGNLRFYTKPESGNFTERLRISEAGDIGIGTTSPGVKLEVVGSVSSSASGSFVDLINSGDQFSTHLTGSFSGSFHGQVGARHHHTQSTPSTTWTINHALGQKYPNVTVYDSNDEMVIPTNVTATTANILTLTFSAPVSGDAMLGLGGMSSVSGRTFIFEQGTASTIWAVTHSLGEQFPAVTVYDDTDRVIIPESIYAVDGNRMEISFQDATSGNGHFSVGNGLPGVNANNAGNFMRVSAGGTHIEYTTSTADVTGSFDVTGSIILTGDGNVSSSATSTGSFGNLFIAGNISASGVVRADAFESVTTGDSINFADSVEVVGSITASSGISVDGNLTGSSTSTGSFGSGYFDKTLYVGTTTHSNRVLKVHGTSGDISAEISNDATSNAFLRFSTDLDGTHRSGIIGMDYSDNVLRINHGGSFDGVNNGMAINSSGDIGIGVAPNANFKTYVYDNTNSADAWALNVYQDGAGGNGLRVDVDSTDASDFIFQAGANGGSTEVLNVMAGGNIGIGTTSPATPLEIAGGNGNDSMTLLRLFNNDANANTEENQTAEIEFKLRGSEDSVISAKPAGRIVAGKDGVDYFTGGESTNFQSYLAFHTSTDEVDVEKLRITSDNKISGSATSTGSFGRVHAASKLAVGTTSPHPNATLNVENTAGISMIYITSAANNDTSLVFEEDSTAKWMMGHDNSNSDAFTISDGNGFASGTKFTMLSSGNVGIGETSPDELLHIKSSTASKPVIKLENAGDVTNGAQLHFVMSTTSEGDNDIPGTIRFKGQNDASEETEFATIYARNVDVSNGTEDGELHFRTIAAGSLDTSMIIKSGRVGIGTTSPAYRLQVSEAESAASDFQTNLDLTRTWDAGSATDRYHGLIFSDSNSVNAGIFANRFGSNANYNSDLHFYTNSGSSNMTPATALSTSKMMITAAGLVGIGTSSPADKLQVAGKTIVGTHNSNAHGLFIESTHSTNKYGGITAGYADNNQQVGLKFTVRDTDGAANNVINLDHDAVDFFKANYKISGSATSTGSFAQGFIADNLGIGHNLTTHSQKLVVKRNAAATTLTAGVMVNLVNEQGAGNTATIRFTGAQQNAYLGYFDGSGASNQKLAIGVGSGGTGTGQVTITGEGYVGIGHSAPTELLHVKKSTGDVNAIVESVAAGTTPTLHIKAPADRVGVIKFHEGGALKNSIFSGTDDSLNFYTNSGNDAVLQLKSDKSIRMYGDVQIDGVLDIDNVGNVSGSSTSTGSFGALTIGGSALNANLISGRVGIGTTSPGAKLDIRAALNEDALHCYDRSGDIMFEIDQFGQILSYNGIANTNSSGTPWTFSTGATSVLKLDQNSRISLSNNDAGTSNTVFGNIAGDDLASGGNYNSFFGHNSGHAVTTGDYNTAFGLNALDAATVPQRVTAIGTAAMRGAVTADAIGTVAIGYAALNVLTSGERNLAIGYEALDALTVGDDNIAIGYQALTNLGTSTFANRNIAIGTYAMLSAANNNMSDNVAIGYGALSQSVHSDGDANVAIGSYAMSDLTAGAWAMVGVGDGALRRTNHADSVGSVGVGYFALNANVSGIGNTAVGFQALMDMTTGDKNTAVGYEALENCVDGYHNTALGYQALTTDAGNNNTGIGLLALRAATGNQHTAVGSYASHNIGGGANNTSLGFQSLLDIVDGSQNVAIGSQAIGGTLGTTADNSSDLIAIGYQALGGDWGNTTLTDNIAIGTSAMGGAINGAINCVAIGRDTLGGALTTGANGTVGIGVQALKYLTTGASNIAIGFRSLYVHTTGARNIAIGELAMADTNAGSTSLGSADNVFIGYTAGGGTWTDAASNQNIGIGTNVMNGALAGALNNVGIGTNALRAITSADSNTAIGYLAGNDLTTGHSNVAIGSSALLNSLLVDRTVIIGGGAGAAVMTADADGTIAIGNSAGAAITSGIGNTSVGYQALMVEDDGDQNTAIGYQALVAQTGTSGTVGNTAVGYKTLDGVTTGVKNTAIGAEAMGSADGAEEQNVAIGYKAMFNNNNGLSNTCIGSGTLLSAAAGQGQIAIGRDVACIANETATIGFGSNVASLGLDGSDTSWAASSDERLKENITDATAGLDVINDLRPVTYNWKKAKDIDKTMPQYKDSEEPVLGKEYGETLHGFVAQEVKAVIDKHDSIKEGFKMWKESDDGTQTVADGNLVPILVKAVQELTARVKELEDK